jgi:hypothetical protein
MVTRWTAQRPHWIQRRRVELIRWRTMALAGARGWWCYDFLTSTLSSATEEARGQEPTYGVFSRRGAPEQDEAQASTFGDNGREHQGTTHDEVRQNRCGVVSRWPVSGRWSSGGVTRGEATKGVNLAFASVFDEIPARGSSIYRGFGLMILCVCRTPSPPPLIQLGFDFDPISLGFFSWGRKFPTQVHYLMRGR